jgi:hypothetical protein
MLRSKYDLEIIPSEHPLGYERCFVVQEALDF